MMNNKELQNEKAKYNDQELYEFKKSIDKKLAEAIHEYDLINEQIRSNISDSDSSTMHKIMEDASETNIKEELNLQAGRLIKFIDALRAALIRIENKTYGKCRVTGKLIPRERLLAVPHTTVSIEAKLGQKKH